MRKTSFLASVFMLFFCAAVAETPQRVTAAHISPVTVRIGSRAPMQITLHIQPGFHINSSKPLTPELIPTEVRFMPPEDVVIGKIQYPPGVLMTLPFDPANRLSVYSGDVTVKAVVFPAPKAGTGTITVHGEVKYQACDNSACYPPKRLPIAFDVRILSAGSKVPKARPTRTSPHIHN